MMQGWGTQGWGMGGGFVMVIVSVVVIVGIVFVARWAMEQGGRGRKPPAG